MESKPVIRRKLSRKGGRKRSRIIKRVNTKTEDADKQNEIVSSNVVKTVKKLKKQK
jgi:hypothetical protein